MPKAAAPRTLEIGRVVLINYGPNRGKLATVVDILDSKRVIVDGPEARTGISRQQLLVSRLSLTPISFSLPRGVRQKALCKAFDAAKVLDTWNATAWAKGIAVKETRAKMTDFDRFKVMVAKKTRTKATNAAFNKLKKAKK